MGLELLAFDSDHEKAFNLLIELLVERGQAVGLKSTIHFPQNSLDGPLHVPRRDDSPIQDPLLSLILKPESADLQGFLEDLRCQRVR
jgi:hypothetical protein